MIRDAAETGSTDTVRVAWRLERSPEGTLDFVDSAGLAHPDVDIVKAFPVSDPQGPIAILSADGRELAWIESLSSLPAEPQRVVAEELANREFRPVIESIVSIVVGEPAHWTVLTDRGPCRFSTSQSDAIERRTDGKTIVTDTHGTRYVIPDISKLDRQSRLSLSEVLA